MHPLFYYTNVESSKKTECLLAKRSTQHLCKLILSYERLKNKRKANKTPISTDFILPLHPKTPRKQSNSASCANGGSSTRRFLILLLFQLFLGAVVVHQIGVVQMSGEGGLDAVDILPAQGIALGQLLGGEGFACLDAAGILVDFCDFFFGHVRYTSPFR